ncbi:hypothetical protein ACWER6_35975 [Streptomyces sp. NPDC004009]
MTTQETVRASPRGPVSAGAGDIAGAGLSLSDEDVAELDGIGR